jgi:hypothetical protein
MITPEVDTFELEEAHFVACVRDDKERISRPSWGWMSVQVASKEDDLASTECSRD